jgi:hypothetical protein
MNWFPNETLDVMQNIVAALAPLTVGIRRQAAPPVRFGAQRLHRMHVLVMEPRQGFEVPSPSDDLEQILPCLSGWPSEAQARPVLGEILRGENGALYERFGNRICPLRRLVSGPSGELLELAGEPAPGPLARRAAPAMLKEPEAPEEKSPETKDETAAPQARSNQEPNSPGESTPVSTFRALLPEPGQWRVVRLGDFKQMLVPQLAHPERLRDLHRLPCYAQVLEVTAPVRVEALAEALFGEPSATSGFRLLTPAIVQQLQLAPLLPVPGRAGRSLARQPGLLLPHDRVVCLDVANDPTDDSRRKETANNSPGPEQSKTGGPCSEPEQTAPEQAATPASAEPAQAPLPTVPAGAAASGLKTSIPPAFLKPWELRLSREEALYDSMRARSFFGRLRSGLRRFAAALLFDGQFRKWQILLSGKNLDEQLWAVRPPKGALNHPSVRTWLERTLEAAGYDARTISKEWELYWRQKGM